MTKRVNKLWNGLWLCAAVGCAEQVQNDSVAATSAALSVAGASDQVVTAARLTTLNKKQVAAGSASRLGAAASAVAAPELRLQLLDGKTARLSVQLDPELSQLRIAGDKARTLKLSAGPKEPAIEFNDSGNELDERAGDGLFSGAIPIDVDALTELNAEAAKLTDRTAFRFKPGTREVVGRFELPQNPIDIERLRAGAEISIPDLGEFGPFQTLGGTPVAAINPQKSLMITSIPVIEDPARTMNPCDAASANSPLKPWTFGHLMDQLAQGSGLSSSQFVEQWLQTWLSPQVVHATGSATVLDATSAAAAANMTSLVIDPWRARSGGGDLDLSIAPFRLQGIFYRPDLGQVSYGSAANNAGELRFVFGLLEVRDANNDGNAQGPGDTCQVTEMAVIFEFGVPITDCLGIKQFANQFVGLSALLPGDPAFGTQLEALTESVVTSGAAPSKPNQSALNQLRSNEIDLTQIWQFREYVITPGNGPLMLTTTKNNPRQHAATFTSVPGVTPLPDDLSANWVAELNSSSLPELSGGLPFLGGSVSYNIMSWDDASLTTPAQRDARFRFSLNTCSSCHTRETQTIFYHVRPSGPGGVPTLSNFLQTSPFVVSDVNGISHTFAEKDNRKQALANFANAACGFHGRLPFEVMRSAVISTE